MFRFDLEKALTKNERLQRQLTEALESSRSTRSPSEPASSETGAKETEGTAHVVSPTAPGGPPVSGGGGGGGSTNEKSPPVTNEEVS